MTVKQNSLKRVTSYWAFSEGKQTQVAAKTWMSTFDFQFVELRAPHQKKNSNLLHE